MQCQLGPVGITTENCCLTLYLVSFKKNKSWCGRGARRSQDWPIWGDEATPTPTVGQHIAPISSTP